MSEVIDNAVPSKIEEKIAMQCAPVIVGIKIANLLVLNAYEEQYALNLFQDTQLMLQAICKFELKTYYLLYQPKKLKEYIQQQQVLEYLKELGYLNCSLDIILQEVAYKYNKFMYERSNFPHEIGLLLGYPLNDVLRFIEEKGTGYLYSGYWKVYDNLPETLFIFSQYHRARQILKRLILHGGKLSSVIREVIQYECIQKEAQCK